MRLLTLSVLLMTITFGCQESYLYDVDLVGEWLLLRSCDSCMIYEFKDDRSLILRETNNESIYKYEYEWFKVNNIKIFNDDFYEMYQVKTYSKDSIEIMGFTLSGIPEEMNSLLKRIR